MGLAGKMSNGSTRLHIGRFRFNVMALIHDILSTANPNFQFNFTLGKIHFQGNQGKTLALRVPDQALNFPSMKQKLSTAGRFMIESVAEFIGLNG